jgi:hypothetical protein
MAKAFSWSSVSEVKMARSEQDRSTGAQPVLPDRFSFYFREFPVGVLTKNRSAPSGSTKSTASSSTASSADATAPGAAPTLPAPSSTPATALQQHIQFFDRDHDNIITCSDIYNGFRELGFSIIFSIGALLINLFFSYPTRLAHSWFPDPYFRIYVNSIHKAKHGSDTGVYDSDGNFRADVFDDMFAKLDKSGTGSLGVTELGWLLKKDRVVADPAGWSFAFMEWWTTWLLLQKGGRVWKEDLRQCYDGTIFWRIREDRLRGKGWPQGYGWGEFFRSIWSAGTWKEWEVKSKH